MRSAKIQTITKQLNRTQQPRALNKKRTLSDALQPKVYESSKKQNLVRNRDSSNSKNGKTTQSDTDPQSESLPASQRAQAELEEGKTQKPKIDEAFIDKAIKARNEEKFFEKEFTKDLKKMQERAKLEADIRELREKDPNDPEIAKLSKKLKGQTKKPDIYDKFAEDEMGVDEFIEKVKQKNSKGTANIGRNKRFPNFSQRRLN